MNVITGMPRSGSTLLCNILNQNPTAHASSTSPVCQLLVTMAQTMATQAEVMSECIAGDKGRVARAQSAVARAWYYDQTGTEVFDKGRGWAGQVPLYRALWPGGAIVCLVRDPRQIFASIEARHEETAYLQPGPHGGMAQRAAVMMTTDGLIGSNIVAVEDLLRRDPDRCLVLEYEKLVADPARQLRRIEELCGLDAFEYDFENVEATATDVDALYHGKFPHDGSGPVATRPPRQIPADVARHIAQAFPFYMERLKYTSG